MCLIWENSVTHRSLVVLRLCGEEAVDLLHSCHLDLQVGQVPHNPVQVVGDLHGDTHRETGSYFHYQDKEINHTGALW